MRPIPTMALLLLGCTLVSCGSDTAFTITEGEAIERNFLPKLEEESNGPTDRLMTEHWEDEEILLPPVEELSEPIEITAEVIPSDSLGEGYPSLTTTSRSTASRPHQHSGNAADDNDWQHHDEVGKPQKSGPAKDDSHGNGSVGQGGSSGTHKDQTSSPRYPSSPQPSDDDVKSCAQSLGIHPAAVKIAGNGASMTLTADQGLLVRLSGNRASLNLTIPNNGDDLSLAGICIFARGNQPSVQVSVEGKLGAFIYNARGNQGHALLNFAETGTVQSLSADLSGNRNHLTIQTVESSLCQAVQTRLGGSGSTVTCHTGSH